MTGLLWLIQIAWRDILKTMFQIAVFCLVVSMGWGWLVGYSMDHAASSQHVPTPVPGVPTAELIIGATIQPVEEYETITIDQPVLNRNVEYPVHFKRSPLRDPVGAYYATLDFRTGTTFQAVYIVPDTWKRGGGRIVITNEMPVSAFYYTVITYKGTSQQVIYDRQKNIVYSMVENPDILS
jgi:hypothetical protein